MPRITGATVLAWRRSMGWDVPETARRLRKAAGSAALPHHEALVRMIRRWEREDSGVSERYELLYRDALGGGPSAAAPRLADALASASLADLAAEHDPRSEIAGIKSDTDLIYAAEHAAFGRPAHIASAYGAGRIGIQHIQQIERTTSVFRRWDNEYGGGLRRKAVIGQLSEVTGLLDGPFEGEHAERRLFSAVADLAQLAGWMSWDLQLHATAQRYYLLALNLARDAGDRPQVARLLYCLARQMVDIGRYRDALDLAMAGSYAIRRESAPKAIALLHIAEARAYACMGGVRDCRAALGAAQDSFGRAAEGTDPDWCGFFDEGELAGLVGVTLRDLALADPDRSRPHAAEAQSWIEQAVSARSSAFLRSKVLDMDGLAVICVLLGEPGRAADLATSAIGLSQQVSSPRASRRLMRTVQLGREAFPGAAPWADLGEQVRALPAGR
jgi:hypothetical protein